MFELKRTTLYSILRFLLFRLTDLQFVHTENLPKEGGFLLATNHMSRIDTPVLMMNPVRPEITALVADKYKKDLLFAWFINSAGAIWLDREKADFAAFRAAQQALKDGLALGIAPEGTRSNSGSLQQGKPGTILLAMRSSAPIIPCAIAGSEVAFRMIFTLRRPKITVTFGKPYALPEIGRENRDQAMQDAADEIMCRIAALLPEKYHGFYAGDPRIKELIVQGAV
jgi:1-acyl-sn-glycerol-3-phosphate acyltransferase